MFINEVCKTCALTKKAVEYYIAQGLVAPSVQENGYRDFSDADIERLKKISVLRGLGISAAELQKILSVQHEMGDAALKAISDRKRMEIAVMQEKRQLLQELSRTQDWDLVQEKLRQLQNKQSVLARLQEAFPGYYGNYICQHFAPYLNEPVETQEQQEAFETILDFLDRVHLELPADLQAYYCEVTAAYDDTIMETVDAKVKSAYGDMERFLAENREAIEAYMKYKASEAYQSSNAFRLEQEYQLKQFISASGYYEVFLPAMCRLSKSYREYRKMMMNANQRFVQEGLYGQAETN